MTHRIAKINRNTAETQVSVTLNLDGDGNAVFDTGIPFLEHMLHQIARHGAIDLDIQATGDLHIDDHHTVEDIGITLGQASAKALGDKAGICRYGHAYVPLDEALSRVVIDFSGRPLLTQNVVWPEATIGKFATTLIHEFFQGFCNHALATVHIDSLRGANSHHIAETMFKAFGRAMRMAVAPDPRVSGIPSTKGVL
jgi:imidazoleglycerol-phosphate dehydratase